MLEPLYPLLKAILFVVMFGLAPKMFRFIARKFSASKAVRASKTKSIAHSNQETYSRDVPRPETKSSRYHYIG